MDAVGRLADEVVKALSTVTGDDRERLVDAIVGARRVFVFGVGRSGLVAQAFAVRLVQLGLHVYFVGDMTTPILAQGDLVLLVSNTGETMSVVKTATIARRLGCRVYSVTSDPDAPLAANSDDVLYVRPAGSHPDAPLGTLFEDSVLIFFDSLVPDLMRRLGADEEAMRGRHAIWVRSLAVGHQGAGDPLLPALDGVERQRLALRVRHGRERRSASEPPDVLGDVRVAHGASAVGGAVPSDGPLGPVFPGADSGDDRVSPAGVPAELADQPPAGRPLGVQGVRQRVGRGFVYKKLGHRDRALA